MGREVPPQAPNGRRRHLDSLRWPRFWEEDFEVVDPSCTEINLLDRRTRVEGLKGFSRSLGVRIVVAGHVTSSSPDAGASP